MTDDTTTPAFKLIERPPNAAPKRRVQRNWKPVLAALTHGGTLFLPLADISDSNVKYLSLALDRRGNGEKLRTQRAVDPQDRTVEGRLLWVER